MENELPPLIPEKPLATVHPLPLPKLPPGTERKPMSLVDHLVAAGFTDFVLTGHHGNELKILFSEGLTVERAVYFCENAKVQVLGLRNK